MIAVSLDRIADADLIPVADRVRVEDLLEILVDYLDRKTRGKAENITPGPPLFTLVLGGVAVLKFPSKVRALMLAAGEAPQGLGLDIAKERGQFRAGFGDCDLCDVLRVVQGLALIAGRRRFEDFTIY